MFNSKPAQGFKPATLQPDSVPYLEVVSYIFLTAVLC